MRPRLYYAAPLFSDAERTFNDELAAVLETWCEVYLPQRDGCLIVDLVQKFHIPWSEAAAEVFERDRAAIDGSDLFVLIMDGRSVDEGASFELGYAYAKGKTCWGLKTDPRQLLSYGDNPMIIGGLSRIFSSRNELVSSVSEWSQLQKSSLSKC